MHALSGLLASLGNLEVVVLLMAGMASGVLAWWALGLKFASASGSNLGDMSKANQVSAGSSQVLGMWPLRATHTNPTSINSALQRHIVVFDCQPRLLNTDQVTVKLPLLLPRYCPGQLERQFAGIGA